MKSQFKRFSKSSISVVLCLCMLVTCVTAGIITTDAAKIDSGAATDASAAQSEAVGAAAAPDEAVGAAVQDDESVGRGDGFILYGTSDNPAQWSDTGAAVTQSGSEYTATISKDKFTNTGSNYFVGISSSSNVSNMFFQSQSISVSTSGSCFSGSGSQSKDNYRFARISFSSQPANDVILKVNTSSKKYSFSVAEGASYNVEVTAGTGGSVLVGSTTVSAGTTKTVAIGSSAIGLNATPAGGYKFDKWDLTESATGSVSVADVNDPTTTVTASGAGGKITAIFSPLSSTTRRIYFDNSSANWSQPYAYAYDAADIVYSAYWPGTKMSLYKGKVWYVDVSTDATKVIFNQGNATNQTPGLTIPTTYTKPTYYRHMGSNPSWAEYTESTSANKKTATLDPNSTSGMYTNIDATFYDYYTDSECNGTYYSSIRANEDGWVNGISERNPYRNLNESLSKYAQLNSVAYPMYYYANYHDSSFHSQGYTNEYFQVNDSNGLGGNHKAVTGLSGKALQNNNIHHYQSGADNENGPVMAMFDEEWLTSRSGYTYNGTLATMINTKFPVRKSTITGYPTDKLYIDTGSTDSGSNGWFVHFFNKSDSSVYLDVRMVKSSGTLYTVTNPDTLAYDGMVIARVSDNQAPHDNWSNVWNKTVDLDCPTGANANIKFNISGYSGSTLTGSWAPQTGITQQSYTYYEFDSTGGKDNIWFDDCTSAAPTLYYGAGTSNAKKNGYNGGYSFLPFDNNATGKAGYGKDLGFGMRLDINFTLGRDNNNVEIGQVDGVDQVFRFSGDDDLWVFVDDQLVLDLGGSHAATNGTINFHTKDVTVSPAAYTTLNSASRNTSFTLADKEVHKMTIFYTERGMHESNLKFGFSFAPVDTDLKVNKVVSPANVNGTVDRTQSSGYAAGSLAIDALAAADNDVFNISHTWGPTKNTTAQPYSYTSHYDTGTGTDIKDSGDIGSVMYVHTDENGNKTNKVTTAGTNNTTYQLKENESARFTNVLHKETYLNKYFKLKESTDSSSLYNYIPSFTVVDRETGQVLSSLTTPLYVDDNGTPGNPSDDNYDAGGGVFKFNNGAESATVGDMTPVNLDATFTNRIKTHNLMISKYILGDAIDPNDTFTIKVEVDVDASKTGYGYKTYALTYFGSKSGTMTTSGDDAGKVTLKADEFIIIPGIPENARVRVTEVDIDSDYSFDSMETSGVSKASSVYGTVTNGVWFTMTSDAFVDVLNQPIDWDYRFIYHYPSRLTEYQKTNPTATDRIFGDDQSYTVTGKISDLPDKYIFKIDDTVEFYFPDEVDELDPEKPVSELLQAKAPYEDNFKETVTWNLQEIIDYGNNTVPATPCVVSATTNGSAQVDHCSAPSSHKSHYKNNPMLGTKPVTIQSDKTNRVVTANIYAYVRDNFNVHIDFALPYDFGTSSSGMTFTYNDDEEQSVNMLPFEKKIEGTTRFQNQFTYYGDYVKAPDCLKNSQGGYVYFRYWAMYARSEDGNHDYSQDEPIRKCFSQKYNLASYDNYYIVPVYESGGHISSQAAQEKYFGGSDYVQIHWLENSRNQWNYGGGDAAADLDDEVNPAKWNNFADRLFSDFVLEYRYNDNELINQMSSTNEKPIKTGVVIERVGELYKQTPEAEPVTDLDEPVYFSPSNPELAPYAYRTKENEDASLTAVRNYISHDFDPSWRGGKALTYQDFNFTELDNKNMMELYYSLANFYQYGTAQGGDNPDVATNPTNLRNYVYRAYAYIQVGNSAPVVSTKPAYFTVYDIAVINTEFE